jgi:hypothetical protein
MRNLCYFLIILFFFGTGCEKDTFLNNNTDETLKVKTTPESLVLSLNSLMTIDKSFKNCVIDELSKTDFNEILLIELLDKKIINYSNRTNYSIIDFIIQFGVFKNKNDAMLFFKEYPDFELRIHQRVPEINYTNLKRKDIPIFYIPDFNTLYERENINIKYFDKGREYIWSENKEPDYDFLIFCRSEDVVVFENLSTLLEYAKKIEGNEVKNDFNLAIFKHKFYKMIPNPDAKIKYEKNGRTLCERDNRDHNLIQESIYQFKTGSVFEGIFNDWGEFVVTQVWGVKSGQYSGAPSTKQTRFKTLKSWNNTWLSNSNYFYAIPTLYWTDDKSREIKYIWAEEDSGGTITIGATFGTSYKESPTSSTTYNFAISFQYSIKNDHDQIGETIVTYCEPIVYYSPGISEPGHWARFSPNVGHRNWQ